MGGGKGGLTIDDGVAYRLMVVHQEGRTTGREGVVRGSLLFFRGGG